MLNALAAGGEVITSRGELVEIGGSYRVPDVVAASGCKLVEVGTTNRTRVGDYERAITPETALLLKTHTSNYRITGFTAEASVPELAQLAHRRGIPLVVDLGSGYLAPEDGARLPELDIQALLDAGADLVSFSGDKLLGGPQAGIVLGRASLIHKLRASPLWRVVRIDKFTVAALAATLVEHLRLPEEEDAVEITRRNQVGTTPEDLQELAEGLAQCLSHAQPKWDFNVAEDRGYYGGGSLPEEHIPAPIVRINCPHLSGTELDEHLRRGNPPVVGYLRSGEYALNVLALVPGDVELIVGRIKEL
jgi:L-seryl-tRNA(Ser) seleniumtransferase